MTYPRKTLKSTTVKTASPLGQRRAAASKNMITDQLQTTKDTGRYDAFDLNGNQLTTTYLKFGPSQITSFEALILRNGLSTCYFLEDKPGLEPVLDGAIEELVEMTRDAQEPDR